MVHIFKMNANNIAVDANSGSIHILEPVCADILSIDKNQMPKIGQAQDALLGKYSTEDIQEAFSELQELVSVGQLYSDDSAIKEATRFIGADNRIKALCLHVAHDCNLACTYCFASKGDYKTGRELMSQETACKALDFLIENSGNRKTIEVDFFGGEPLLNMDVVKATVEYGRGLEEKIGKKFFFTITTNGMLLNEENTNFINKNMGNIVISIDGRKELHDEMRPDRGGNGSYDRIVPLAKRLIEQRGDKSHFVRGTFTSKNKDFTNDVMHLVVVGFKEISIEPAVGDIGEASITENDLPEILREYELLAEKYIEGIKNGEDYRFYHFSLSLFEGPCIYKRIASCGAGFEYIAVSPDGKLYPCHQFVGQEEFVLGDINKGIINKEIAKDFKNSNIDTKSECASCWAKLFCSGGCHANAYYTNGDINIPSDIACQMQKKRIECAIAIQAAIL